jgi:hypothetical protein
VTAAAVAAVEDEAPTRRWIPWTVGGVAVAAAVTGLGYLLLSVIAEGAARNAGRAAVPSFGGSDEHQSSGSGSVLALGATH